MPIPNPRPVGPGTAPFEPWAIVVGVPVVRLMGLVVCVVVVTLPLTTLNVNVPKPVLLPGANVPLGPKLTALLPVTDTAPLPCKVADALMFTGPLALMMPAEVKATVPALTFTVPLIVLVLLSVSEPGPNVVSAPAAIGELIVPPCAVV